MIQRPQSICMLIIIVSMLAVIAFPNFQITNAEKSLSATQTAFRFIIAQAANPEKIVDTQNRVHIAGGALLVIGLTAFSLSRFKNRLLQMKLGFGITLSIALTLVGIMYGAKAAASLGVPQVSDHGIGFWASFLALFANILSNRLIRKDENLVRSMDRIR